jgi:hypothetical protein
MENNDRNYTPEIGWQCKLNSHDKGQGSVAYFCGHGSIKAVTSQQAEQLPAFKNGAVPLSEWLYRYTYLNTYNFDTEKEEEEEEEEEWGYCVNIQ